MKALLVGIDNYWHINGLNFCIADAVRMNFLLTTTCGLKTKDISMLLGDQATKENIIAAMTELMECDDQSVLLYFSGHGSYIQSTTEEDKTDELYCTVDLDFKTCFGLLDNEIASIFAMAPDKRIVFMSDSCHSGDLDRGGSYLLDGCKKRFVSPPPNIKALKHLPRPMILNPVLRDNNIIFLSACKSDETASESPALGGGAFTVTFCKEIQKDPRLSAYNALGYIRQGLIDNDFLQEPQLHCSDENESEQLIQV
jgi:uncharacterized caspase-like protein